MKNQITNIGNLVVPPPYRPPAKGLWGQWLSVALVALTLLGARHQATGFILGPAFTYHGRLQHSAAPVNGSYDLTFSLYTNVSGGSAVEGPLTNTATAVNDGLFTARLDFGQGVFDGTAYWLEIGVRTNGDGAFTILSPRHELTATPYAVYAENTRAGGVNNRISTGAQYAFIGGGISNSASGPGSFIGGGGADGAGTFAGNNASGGASVIGGGLGNTNTGLAATIGGGYGNTAGFLAATVGGGQVNTVSSSYTTVGGGFGNTASGYQATVGGGSGNTASGSSSTVPGGLNNVAGGDYSFAAGEYAVAYRPASFVWSDGSQSAFRGAPADKAFSVLASGGVFFYDATNGVHIDSYGDNDGNLDFGLRFGSALQSGEGIASKRTTGGNQYGLDFYTASNNRMSIDSNGKVGINTSSPSERLEVNGNYVLIDGANAADGTSGPIQAYIGGDGGGSDVQVGSMNPNITAVGFWNHSAGAWMHISCSSITIHGGADLAEPFAMADDGKEIPQGAVVVIDEKNPGQLKMSDQPYDSRVAGVVSGANGINPGIQLQQQGALDAGKNVALTGRVYVQADACNGPIKPGDLLTTASTPGHAMRVTDHLKAQGAILGKAMTGLRKGKGMVLVLVTLQ